MAPAPGHAATIGTVPSSTLLLVGWGLALGIAGLCVLLIVRFRKAHRRAELSAAALDALDDAVLLCDRSGRALSANAKWRARFGDGAGLDVLQARLDDIGPLSRLRVAIAAGESAREDIALLGDDGRKSWSVLAVGPATGFPDAALWRLGDAATRNALDGAIAAQFVGMVGFLDDFPLGCAVVAEDGSFRQANLCFAQWLGTTPEALIGDGVRLADIVADPRPADALPWRALPVDADAAGCAVGEVALKDGYGRRFIAQLSQVELDEGGVPASLLLVRDVSGEHDLAAALRHAETRFHRFFDEAPFGVALLDPEGRISECSKAFDRMVSAGPGSATGQQLWDYVEEDDRDRLRHWFAAAATGDDGMPLQITFSEAAAAEGGNDGDGDGAVAASLFASRYEAEDGAPGGVVVHALDQTEQRSIENQFFQSQKMELVGQL
ncbi:MAG: PAS domain-containing protein, partial [Alphaproteobacteria bacterium]